MPTERDVHPCFLMDESTSNANIKKEFDILTPQEQTEHATEVKAGKYREVNDLYELGCFRRKPLKDARNTIEVKWVIKWKLVDGKRIIKVRMTVRGFKDRAEGLETYAGTASRCDQRVTDSVATLDDEFEEFSLDV